jgi:hypothetical protein
MYGDDQSLAGAARFEGNERRFCFSVAHEENAFCPCLKVVFFPETVGDNVLVQDYNLTLRVEHLKPQGILNRICTANSRAIFNPIIRLNALDHDHRSQP